MKSLCLARPYSAIQLCVSLSGIVTPLSSGIIVSYLIKRVAQSLLCAFSLLSIMLLKHSVTRKLEAVQSSGRELHSGAKLSVPSPFTISAACQLFGHEHGTCLSSSSSRVPTLKGKRLGELP